MTGSRGALVYIGATGILLSAAMLWGAPIGKIAGYRLVKAIRRSFAFIALAMVLLVSIFPDVTLPRLTFYRESLMPGSEYNEVGNRTWEYPVGELQKAFADPQWMTGYGIGTFSLGGQYVSRIMEVPRLESGVESGFGALILEFGILGPIIWIVWSASLLAAAFRTSMKLKGTWGFPIGIAITWYTFILLFTLTWGGIAPYQNYVINAYFWLFVGILFKLPHLVKKSDEIEGGDSAQVI